MKSPIAMMILSLFGGSTAYCENSRETRQAAMRESFHFAPAPVVEKIITPADESVIVLEALTITESMEKRAIDTTIQERKAREAADAFAWTKGGLISSGKLGSFQADKGIWITLGDRTSGAQASRELFVEVEVLRLRW